jgi:hypothetical protein
VMAHLGLRAVGTDRDTIRPNPCGDERIPHRLAYRLETSPLWSVESHFAIGP